MHNHRLIKLLKTFSKKEMTRFGEFAASPYHNKHSDTLALIQCLSNFYPDFTEKRCNRNRLWKSIFGQQSQDHPKLALLFTYAVRLLEEFLVIDRLKSKETYAANIWLLRELRDRRVAEMYRKQLKHTEKKLNTFSFQDKSFYEASFHFYEEANYHYVQTSQRKEDDSLQEKQRALDQYYLIEKLRDAVEMQVRSQIIKGDYSARLMEAVIDEVRSNPGAYEDAPAIKVYFYLNEMMENPSQENYRYALQLFTTHQHIFRVDEQGAIYNYFQNCCIAGINRNEMFFLRELFELYQMQLERGLLSEEGYLVEWHYKNIVTTGIRLQEMHWTEEFIETYKDALHPNAAENAYRFNKAAHLHAIGRYAEVLPLLVQVEYSDFRYNLGAKALLLRTYYELDEFDALHALVETFRQYLQRNRLLADVRRGGYYQLFRFTRRAALLRIGTGFQKKEKTKTALQRLRKEMIEADTIYNRAWLEDKLQEIEAKI